MGRLNEKTSRESVPRHLIEKRKEKNGYTWKIGYALDGEWILQKNLSLEVQAEQDKEENHKRWGIAE